MNEKLIDLQLGSLLHDIGKIVRRAGVSNKNHSEAGLNYLKDNNLINKKNIEDMILYHHYDKLENSDLSKNSLAYIVYEADNIASGIDRVLYDEKSIHGNERSKLNSVFNRVYSPNIKEEKNFNLEENSEESFNMPKIRKNDEKIESQDYLKVLETLKKNIMDMKEHLTPEKLNTVFEQTCIYFPSSAYVDYPDISYYDHVKLTAALAGCMYLYDEENGIDNFKDEYFKHYKKTRKSEKFLLVSGEFTGIQDFIYTVTSKMAMKSLRGRSLYLELFTEHIIDEILKALDLSRVNLIYSGGSGFYMLLPNIEKSREILKNYKNIVNDFLLETSGTSLYFEMVASSTSAEELGNKLSEKEKKENVLGKLFKKDNILMQNAKLKRYSSKQLEKLFDEDSELNKIKSYTKECVICKKSESEKVLEKNKLELGSEIELCNSCKNFIQLGKDIAKIYHSGRNKNIFIVEEPINNRDKGIIFPIYPNGYITLKTLEETKVLENLKNDEKSIYRFYSINSYYFGEGLSKNIWIGNYTPQNIEGKEIKENLIEFKDLVKKSKGIERLGVLRADIDNLGEIFQNGFVNKTSETPYKYVTLSKSVVLSRYLSDFFKRKIILILEKSVGANESNELFKKYCDVINEGNARERNIVVVYAGGDDLFVIGTWNDIIEFAVDLRTAFKEFSSGKITMSAGIGIFSENYPVYQMAKRTGELEELAKNYSKNNNQTPTKDAVALFGKMSNTVDTVYSWDEFIDEVLYTKYKYIKSVTTFNERENSEKIFVGKSKWYKIMDLIRDILDKNEKLDIARFAYILARIKYNNKNEENYKEFKKELFRWIKNPNDAKQLLTAINIRIYEKRGE